jgi:NADPH2:quinone reductase
MRTIMMKRIVFHQYGHPPVVLKAEDGPEPDEPGPGQVILKVNKRPIHNGDLLVVSGGHDPIKRELPTNGYTPGCEGVGTIKALGHGVEDEFGFHIGDRVSFFSLGSWQELALVEAEYVTVVPPDLEDEIAAQLFINPVAAMMLARLVEDIAAHPQAGVLKIAAVKDVVEDLTASKMEAGVVLLTVAGSTVARLAAATLKAKGFTPIGLVRSATSAKALEKATGIVMIGFNGENWQQEVRKAAGGRRIFAAMDAVGGKIGAEVLNLLSPAGTLISYGSLTGEPIPVDHVHLCMTAKRICGIGMVHWTQLPYETRAADMVKLIQMVKDNRPFFKIAGEFQLSDISDAIHLFRKPGRDGTVLLIN